MKPPFYPGSNEGHHYARNALVLLALGGVAAGVFEGGRALEHEIAIGIHQGIRDMANGGVSVHAKNLPTRGTATVDQKDIVNEKVSIACNDEVTEPVPVKVSDGSQIAIKVGPFHYTQTIEGAEINRVLPVRFVACSGGELQGNEKLTREGGHYKNGTYVGGEVTQVKIKLTPDRPYANGIDFFGRLACANLPSTASPAQIKHAHCKEGTIFNLIGTRGITSSSSTQQANSVETVGFQLAELASEITPLYPANIKTVGAYEKADALANAKQNPLFTNAKITVDGQLPSAFDQMEADIANRSNMGEVKETVTILTFTPDGNGRVEVTMKDGKASGSLVIPAGLSAPQVRQLSKEYAAVKPGE